MTKRLIKTRKDHRQMRAVLKENTVAQNLTPAAGALSPGGTVGTPYTATFALSAPVGGARYSVASGALPAGLSLNAGTGALTGTPTAAGSFSFSVRGTDDFGNTKSNAYTLAIAAA
jgi:hypothetical protein